MKKLFLIFILIFCTINTSFGLEISNLNNYAEQVPDVYKTSKGNIGRFHYVQEAYGNWEQLIQTEIGIFHITFIEVHNTWTKPFIPVIELKVKKELDNYYHLKVNLVDFMPVIIAITQTNRVALNFENSFEWRPNTKNEGHYKWFFSVDCTKPFIPMKLYPIMKPRIKEKYFRKTITYNNVVVDLSNDAFINNKIAIKFMSNTSVTTNFINSDKNNDNILDIFQIVGTKPLNLNGWKGPKFLRKYQKQKNTDVNNDTIRDNFQKLNWYSIMHNSNFIDINNDNVCDNYSFSIYNKNKKQAIYSSITFDLSKDPFQNKQINAKIGTYLSYIDRNADGINDIYQHRILNSSEGVSIPFIDNNNDSIADWWQTMEGYMRLKLNNFIDIDGDGLCDNYLQR